MQLDVMRTGWSILPHGWESKGRSEIEHAPPCGEGSGDLFQLLYLETEADRAEGTGK